MALAYVTYVARPVLPEFGIEGNLGVVYSIHRNTFNVITHRGSLVAFQNAHKPRTPMGVGIRILDDCWSRLDRADWLHPGVHVNRYDGRLTLGDEYHVISVTDYEIWEPQISMPYHSPAKTREIVSILQDFVPPWLASFKCDGAKDLSIHPPFPGPSIVAVRSAIHRFAEAWLCLRKQSVASDAGLSASDLSAFIDTASGLIGLGPGLTPSGDDFLIGWFASAQFIGGESQRIAQAVAQQIVEAAYARTTILSAQYVMHATRGEWSEPLRNLVLACQMWLESKGEKDCHNSAERIRLEATRLLTIGATSGSDSLAGFIIGLGLYCMGDPSIFSGK